MEKEILMFTGWGATCDVWLPIIPALEQTYQVCCHIPAWVQGNTMTSSLGTLDEYVDEIAAKLHTRQYIIAWSMGGVLAITLASRYPHLVEKICFISSVANFVDKQDVYAGIDNGWFESFYEQYSTNPIRALRKFLTLQVKGDEYAKASLQKLKKMCQFENYNLKEGGYGLKLLRESDLTAELLALKCDAVFVHGEEDAVVNVLAAKHAAYISQSPIYTVARAGHIPHVSHTDIVIQIIKKHFIGNME